MGRARYRVGIAVSDPEPRYRAAEGRLRLLLFGDGTYNPGIAKGEEQRARTARELRTMREAFEGLLTRGGPERVEQAQARIADLEEELRKLATAASRKKPTRRRKAS